MFTALDGTLNMFIEWKVTRWFVRPCITDKRKFSDIGTNNSHMILQFVGRVACHGDQTCNKTTDNATRKLHELDTGSLYLVVSCDPHEPEVFAVNV